MLLASALAADCARAAVRCAIFKSRGTFSTTQAAASSTVRELTGYLAALRATAALAPADLRDASLLIVGDNQAAIRCINNFRSSDPTITNLLRQLFEACLAAGCDVQARWVPRHNIQEVTRRYGLGASAFPSSPHSPTLQRPTGRRPLCFGGVSRHITLCFAALRARVRGCPSSPPGPELRLTTWPSCVAFPASYIHGAGHRPHNRI